MCVTISVGGFIGRHCSSFSISSHSTVKWQHNSYSSVTGNMTKSQFTLLIKLQAQIQKCNFNIVPIFPYSCHVCQSQYSHVTCHFSHWNVRHLSASSAATVHLLMFLAPCECGNFKWYTMEKQLSNGKASYIADLKFSRDVVWLWEKAAHFSAVPTDTNSILWGSSPLSLVTNMKSKRRGASQENATLQEKHLRFWLPVRISLAAQTSPLFISATQRNVK